MRRSASIVHRLLACNRLATWLAQPPHPRDADIANDLQQTLIGRTAMILFGAACSLSMAFTYTVLQNRVVGSLLLTATFLSVAHRLLASRPAAATPALPASPRKKICEVVSSGIIWTSIVGATGALCASSGQMVLAVFASCVVTGLAFGAIFNNSAAPRFARVQVSLMMLPFLAAVACVHAPHMHWIFLQAPLWIGGAFFLIHQAYESVSALIHAQQRATFLALNDQLTGLANRAHIMTVLHDYCATAPSAQGKSSYVLFLDLDGFKGVNDSLGHNAGDELLRAVADRLSTSVRPPDLLGRLGGDEFVVILREVNAEQAREVADRMVARLAESFDLAAAHGVHIGVSIGGTPLTAHTASSVLEKADTLLYAAKRAGKGTVRLSRAASSERQTPREPAAVPA